MHISFTGGGRLCAYPSREDIHEWGSMRVEVEKEEPPYLLSFKPTRNGGSQVSTQNSSIHPWRITIPPKKVQGGLPVFSLLPVIIKKMDGKYMVEMPSELPEAPPPPTGKSSTKKKSKSDVSPFTLGEAVELVNLHKDVFGSELRLGINKDGYLYATIFAGRP